MENEVLPVTLRKSYTTDQQGDQKTRCIMMNYSHNIKHIHLIAICGTGMGSLATLLQEKGYRITGSDHQTYPPMSTHLESLGIKLYSGFKPSNLDEKPDLIIVGNAVSKNNPEVEEMERLQIPYLSMPQALSEFFITGKKSIVIAGTHGKTTTTALMSHLLKDLGTDPSYLVGGILQEGQKNCHAGTGDYFVIEGDEYDTAYFDKGPKFLHYQPTYTIITSVEFDHADIFQDIDHLKNAFKKLIQTIHPEGSLLTCSHYPHLMELIENAQVPVETYGLNSDCDWRASDIQYTRTSTLFRILHKETDLGFFESTLAGEHNVLNALVCCAQLFRLGFSRDDIQKGLRSFHGIKRRQEIRGEVDGVLVMDDFAHHPTAVAETIQAIKKRYPDHALWAVFEPRSNSSIRSIFQEQYAQAFSHADHAILADVFNPSKVKDGKVLNIEKLVLDINDGGTEAVHISGVNQIVHYIEEHIPSPSVVLVMSNGGFGGIHELILQALRNK